MPRPPALTFILVVIFAPLAADETFYIQRGSTWKYKRGTEAPSSPPEAWREPGFGETGWSSGAAPFGYGDPPFGTTLNDMEDNYSTVFLRQTFEVSDASRVGEFQVNVDYDDGFALWLNGVEVLHVNVAVDQLRFEGFAENQHESGSYDNFELLDPGGYLVDGTNVAAVQVLNNQISSSDLKLDLELFDPSGPDLTPPSVVLLVPAAGTTVRSLSQIEVTFGEAVTGVDASDLLVSSRPADSVTGSGRGPYVFSFPEPPPGPIEVRWAAGQGIADQAVPPNAFSGGSWAYTLDPDAPEADLAITEFLAANTSGLRDEDGETSDWVEVKNNGSVAVDVGGTGLTDDPEEPGKWTLPPRTLGAGEYLVIFASGKDRRPTDPGDELHANFKLNTFGEYLGLFSAESPRRVLSEFAPQYPEQRPDFSYGLNGVGVRAYLDPPTPGAPNTTSSSVSFLVADPVFSAPHGLYYQPFTVEISTATAGATIYYTLDGREPTPSSGTRYTGAIDVDGTSSRAVVTLRAAAYKSGSLPSSVVTSTYLFVLDVPSQPARPSGFPTSWGSAPAVDYEMDPEVVNTDREAIEDALVTIPSLSIVMDVNDMFGPSGIYSNPGRTGVSWERPCSAELIDPGGREGFQINCGIRIQGGASRNASKSPKHALRLLFKGAYGPSKLRFPFFPGSPVEEFDTITFRANYNNSWIHWDSGQRSRGSMIRDQWARDSQLALSGLSSHGTYVHVYINGLYWGVYNAVERPSAPFAASHLGGEKEEYDALNSANPIDGDGGAWSTLMSRVNNDLSSNTRYEAVAEMLDVPHFIDYMIVNLYGANADWPGHNWYAVRRRQEGAQWRFISWDAERILEGVTSNSTNVSTGNSPGVVYSRLRANAEFRLLFADHLHRHFFNGGGMTPEATEARWMARAQELNRAVLGEEARWGDYRRDVHSYSNGPYEFYRRESHWYPERERLRNQYFPQRSQNVLNQFRQIGLYPNIGAPIFSQHGGDIEPGFVLAMSRPAGTSGTIYYTTDGVDPREYQSGGISESAVTYSAPFVLNDRTHVKARIRSGTTWSAVCEAIFTVASPFEALRITEIMYNPPTGADFEFVEIQNTVAATIDLSGVSFTNGIDFTFPDASFVGPGEFVVIVSHADAFASLYPGVPIDGVYSGNLDNGGEELTLSDAGGREIVSVDYQDERFWPLGPDGFGYSLVILDPDAPPRSPSSWRASAETGGSPGAEDPPPLHGGIVINEILTASTAPFEDAIELYNPSGGAVNVGGWFLSDSRATAFDLQKFRIPGGTVIPAGGHVVFYEYQFNANPGSPTSFALNSAGDDVYLSSATGGAILTGHIVGHRFQGAEDGVSLGCYMTSAGPDFTTLSGRTFGVDDPASIEEFREGTGGPNATPLLSAVIINEINYHPKFGEIEFVELYNQSTQAVELYDTSSGRGWRLGGVRNVQSTAGDYEFAAGTVIPARGFLLVVPIAPDAFRGMYAIPPTVPIAEPYGGALDNGGELVDLLRPGTPEDGEVPYIVVDHVRYEDREPWSTSPDGWGPSLERVRADDYGNEPLNWEAAHAVSGTPGESNTVSQPGVNQRPVAKFDATPRPDLAALAVLLDASASSDADGTIAAYDWDFGDGHDGSGAQVTHVYSREGTFTVTLTVTDDEETSGSAVRTVTVTGESSGGGQIPGDSNQDSVLDISDVVSLLRRLFLGGGELPCEGATVAEGGNRRLLDVNNDSAVDITDAVYLLSYLFQGGPSPLLGTNCVRIDGCPDVCVP